MRVRRSIMLRLSPLLVATPLLAQAPKKVLTQADWDIWKSINAPELSADGKWAVFTIMPQVGDGELVVRSTSSPTEFRVPRGYISRPNNVPGGLRPRGAAGSVGWNCQIYGMGGRTRLPSRECRRQRAAMTLPGAYL